MKSDPVERVPRTRWRLRCPDCGETLLFEERADACARQVLPCPGEGCHRMMGVSEVRVAETTDTAAVERVATDGGRDA